MPTTTATSGPWRGDARTPQRPDSDEKNWGLLGTQSPTLGGFPGKEKESTEKLESLFGGGHIMERLNTLAMVFNLASCS